MKYLLDTDTLIYWLKGNKKIEEKALAVGLEQLGYSIISHAELYFGAYNSEQIDKNLQAIHMVNQKLALVGFNAASAQLFGKIKADLKQQGNIILDADIMIAAIALSNELVLVTNNEKHFVRVPNLNIENWVLK
ncbi:PilT protein domain protein [Crenothrix polyspora]|uniref:PilT protein domain protein n=1 Tax=Crenothrix polyspora TaxID=360316 RepID=A0A1R4HG48_9GAMM|nr:type II toxin-antitoxin system VapC family toxin [Crenothrix polyspora]SJM94981.1 PilT protein domain protein [Crenothrix polyspora]